MHFCRNRTIRGGEKSFAIKRQTTLKRHKFTTHKNNCSHVPSRSTNEQCMQSAMQTDATLLANNSQHVASVCTPCCMLLGVIWSCCAKFETGQTLGFLQTDETTHNIVGQKNVGSFCIRLHVA